MSANRNTLVFTAFALSCAACGSSSTSDAPNDAGAVDTGVPTQDDGGADAGPVRTLTTVPFLEGVSIQERVADPNMEMVDWFFSDASGTATNVIIDRVAIASAPAGQIGAFISSTKNPKGVGFGTVFKMPGTTYKATMWLGAVGSDPVGVFPGLVTFDQGATGTAHYYAMTADKTTSVVQGNITWEEFTVNAPAEVVSGWGYVYASTDGSQDIYVQRASVLDANAKIGKHAGDTAKAAPLPFSAKKFVEAARARQPVPKTPREKFRSYSPGNATRARAL